MTKYGTAECVYCHIRLKKPEMNSQVTKVKSGNSGTSFSFNPQRSKSLRISSGRNYYRKKEIWYCDNCISEHERQNAIFGGIISGFFRLIWWTFFFPFAFTVWIIKRVINKNKKVIDEEN